MKTAPAFIALLDALDQTVSWQATDRALRSAGLSRRMLSRSSGYLPLAWEVTLVEAVARVIGERHLGAMLGAQHDYAKLGPYAAYVLAAPRLSTALARGKNALPLLQPGGAVALRDAGEHIVISYDSRLGTLNGVRQFDEALPHLLINLVRLFTGDDWSPAWVELPGPALPSEDWLEHSFGAPLHRNKPFCAIAVAKTDLSSPSPRPMGPLSALRLKDLPQIMKLRPPRSVSEQVQEMLQTQFLMGDMSADAIASQMSLGLRTLERLLQAEGHSFRDLKQRFLQERACELLANSNMRIEDVAHCLGYKEPASFRRAFRSWTGQSPSAFSRGGV